MTSYIDCASVGVPPQKVLTHEETVKFVIYDFEGRKEKNGECIDSPILKAHGYKWRIKVYPKGVDAASDNHISCFLHANLPGDIHVNFSLCCKGQQYKGSKRFSSKDSFGSNTFIHQAYAIPDYLEQDQSLVIEAKIYKTVGLTKKGVWYPKKLQRHDILADLYQDASSETSDVFFIVGEMEYRAHKNILALRAKKLYEIAAECDSNVPIPISSVRGEIFKIILDFVYHVKTPDFEDQDIAGELLIAADCYDCVHLKLYVESVIVDKFLTAENAVVLLILADTYSCGLLKEAAMDLFVAETETAKKSEAWSQIKESNRLFEELLDCLVCSKKSLAKNGTSEIDEMDVTAVREELDRAKLELDGSREVLIDRLVTYRQSKGVPKNKSALEG